MKKYKAIKPNQDPRLEVGEYVFEFPGHTWGILRNEEAYLGIPCIAITRDSNGDEPFLVVPTSCLKEITDYPE